ncbi:hypothetical protein U9K52_08470 [Chryseobacterium sp. MHB01]|uniref:hypothetical protein n=1 Tax=Chryseobacterium sp. MHB01 TaxID=3109433 RepID=UPI002AFEB9C7|nr:hypothetical protein [Chryseobacterium sp. MHB01]MEA1848942.1 hypothetical protein [Chryseobacterium sp. MHB01]
MQEFPYLSPVRFYPNEDYLSDMKNPENTIFWGKRADIHFLHAYPLEIREIHRFPVPMNWDDVSGAENLKLFLHSGKNDFPLNSVFSTYNNKISCISFKSFDEQCGRLVVKDNDSDILISNEVKFIDSSDGLGRKYITLSSRHSYNINRFPFEDENCWFHTTIPAYCLGQSSVELELEHNRIGGVSSKRIKEAYSDYATSYEIEAACDSNILNFIENAGRNNLFFIDGIQRTLNEKLERTDKNATGILKVVNVLDKDGNNVLLTDEQVFNGVIPVLKKIYYNIKSSPNEEYFEITQNGQSIDFNTLTSGVISFALEFNIIVKRSPDLPYRGAIFKNGILLTEFNLQSGANFLQTHYTEFISIAGFNQGDDISLAVYPEAFQNNLLIPNSSQPAIVPNTLSILAVELKGSLTWGNGTVELRSVLSSSNDVKFTITEGLSIFSKSEIQFSTDNSNWITANTNVIQNSVYFISAMVNPDWYFVRVELEDIYGNKTYTNTLREYIYGFSTPTCGNWLANIGGLQTTDVLEIEYFDCSQSPAGSTNQGNYIILSEIVGDLTGSPIFCARGNSPRLMVNGILNNNLLSNTGSCAGTSYNPVQVIPGNYASPIDPNIVGSSICFTGNQWTKQVKLSGHPSTNPFIFLMDGVTPAVPGNLASFDNAGASGFNTNGIRWIRFVGLPTGNNVIYDVNPATGKIIGPSTVYNCI